MPSHDTAPTELFVLLSNRGNPDHGQHPHRRLPSTPADAVKPAKDLMQASALCRQYIDQYALGGGNWTGGLVKDRSGKEVARVAYNGRVFAPDAAGGRLVCEASTGL